MKIQIQHNIGKAKHIVSYSDGTKRNRDGSEFFDIAIFKNEREMERFVRELKANSKTVKPTVQCNNCFWQGTEDGLKLIDESKGEGRDHEYIKCCPSCMNDYFLMGL